MTKRKLWAQPSVLDLDLDLIADVRQQSPITRWCSRPYPPYASPDPPTVRGNWPPVVGRRRVGSASLTVFSSRSNLMKDEDGRGRGRLCTCTAFPLRVPLPYPASLPLPTDCRQFYSPL
ncbi:hypothetical protein ElyMa_004355000 [Elysia marginata]|uniref:Uncharacterized protein n=1 Tax=Elysia marginata TaxID=1093978 RepID=A0AAV4H3M3_9GAST|nr:hypothetical protein ElyMa_004355000 [Elysia marginata]